MVLPLALILALTDPQPLLRAHAHNDYEHTRPLFDAIDEGFCSVEADIYLVDGELRVGHDRKDLMPGRTLEKLYLDPMLARVKAHHGHMYDTAAPVTLLVDIKTEGEAVYAELKKRLPRYRSMLTEYRAPRREGGATIVTRAVTVILSGDRPIETLRKEKQRYAFIDGRLTDLDGKLDTSLIPLVSESYFPTFKWLGQGEMPADQSSKLKEVVERAHQAGARIRFWATPDRPDLWKAFYDAGVDLLNTDNLPGLGSFLRSR